MVKITIPLINYSFYIYVGDEEYEKMIKAAKKYGHTVGGASSNRAGWCIGQYIWIRNVFDDATLYHEIFHFLDELFKNVGCVDELEFRAYIAEYVYTKSISWLKSRQCVSNG
jgi:hypothetical protein